MLTVITNCILEYQINPAHHMNFICVSTPLLYKDSLTNSLNVLHSATGATDIIVIRQNRTVFTLIVVNKYGS